MPDRIVPRLKSNSLALFLIGALIVAAALKTWLVVIDVVPFNSDEAVVALMARHILQGERPIFFYGQAYLGSLDAWLVAAGFWVFGEQVWAIRLIQGLLYLGVLITTVRIGKLALGSKRVGVLAAWLLAVPTVIVTLYTTASLGGYGEGLLLGNLILIAGLQIIRSLWAGQGIPSWRWLAWGLLAGFGLWVFGITLVYSVPAGILMVAGLWRQAGGFAKFLTSKDTWKALGLAALGFVLGALPWWVFALQNGLNQLVHELFGSAVAVEQSSWLIRTGKHLVSLILFGSTAAFGLRPSWEIRWLALPLLPGVLAFWCGVLLYIFRRFRPEKPNRLGAGLLVGTMLTLAIGFVFTSFGVDPSGRYFVPLSIPLALFAAEMILSLVERHSRWVWVLAGMVILYNFWGTWQSARRFPPGLTTQFNAITQVDHRGMEALIRFLEEQGETRGYTNYWVSYPLAFLSQEGLIFIPRLPYHEDLRYTPRDDRYPPYAQAVDQASRVAYITTHHPALNEILRNAFVQRGISWQETQIGEYFVFYDLSQVIHPEEIDPGFAAP